MWNYGCCPSSREDSLVRLNKRRELFFLLYFGQSVNSRTQILSALKRTFSCHFVSPCVKSFVTLCINAQTTGKVQRKCGRCSAMPAGPIYSHFEQDWWAKTRRRLMKVFSSIQLTQSKRLLKKNTRICIYIHNVHLKHYSNYFHSDARCYVNKTFSTCLIFPFRWAPRLIVIRARKIKYKYSPCSWV